jgi:threonine aldolase
MGSPLDADYMRAVGEAVHERGLLLHVDGARICNAAAALDTEVRELVAPADSVSFCLSKGLGAPVGSLVCGSVEFIREARRMRKVVGGGMRQSGVLAAAGLVALEEGIPRLPEDHANAKRLAAGLAEIDGLTVDPERVRTNIVFFEVDPTRFSAEAYAAALAEEGVRMLAVGPAMLRGVTHRHITTGDIDRTLAAAAAAAASM